MTKKKQLTDLNSDELRTKLAKNTGKMTKLKLQNDEIVELLRSRALSPIDADAKVELTVDELKTGGWWCDDVSGDCANAFIAKGLPVFNSSEWGLSRSLDSCVLDCYGNVSREFSGASNKKQIHRIGNEFYWGAP